MTTARAIAEAVHGGQDPHIAVNEAVDRAQADTRNAVIRIYRESAGTAIQALQQRLAAGDQPPLAGVPILLKDNLCYDGHEVTACSRILAGWQAPYTASAVQGLLAAGAIPIGATNMDEFAMGSSNETSCYGPVRHPQDPERIPGGSSGGSAAAVAAGITPLALGSDTGGSIRQPAGLCGCIGLKPSYGRVSRYGLLAFASSLDQIGPLATDLDDAWLCLRAITGHDQQDSTSVVRPADELNATTDVKGLRIGYLPAHAELLPADMQAHLSAAQQQLQDAGAELVPVELPHERYATAVYYIIATGEASSNLARYDGVHYGHRAENCQDLFEVYAKTRDEGFGTEVKRRVMLGTYVLSAGYYDAYYKKAMQVRRLMCQDYQQAFEQCDLIIGLTSPSTAFRAGEKLDDPLQMYLCDVFTIAANLAGIPAMSVPGTVHSDGLPVGIHLQAPVWQEARLYRAAKALAG